MRADKHLRNSRLSIEVVLSEHILGEVRHFLVRDERLPNGALIRMGLADGDAERQIKKASTGTSNLLQSTHMGTGDLASRLRQR